MNVRVLSPRLPLSTRARLRAEHRIDEAAGWLVEHGHCRAAELLWRVCHMW